jgi:hypothetical protein
MHDHRSHPVSTPGTAATGSLGSSFVEANHRGSEHGLGSRVATLSTAHGNGAHSVALYVARHHSDRTLRELAQLTGGLQYPAVTMAIRRLRERRLKLDKGLANKIQRVLRMLQAS